MMETIGSVAVIWLPEDGPLLGTEASALDLVGDIYGSGADLIAIPVARFDPDTFRLASGLLGGFIQKLQNYGYRLAIVGDISPFTARSAPLTDFVRETNRRGHHRFAPTAEALRTALAGG